MDATCHKLYEWAPGKFSCVCDERAAQVRDRLAEEANDLARYEERERDRSRAS